MEIPKIIHFCWFGKKSKPKLVKQCISSWRRYFKDYELIEWNEDNYKSNHPFYIGAIENKIWAFASDFARLDILNTYGGIYFDTDLLVVKPFGHLLTNDVIIGAETKDFINAAFLASNKNQLYLSDCLNYYDKLLISTDERELMKITIPQIMTEVLFANYLDILEFDKIIDVNGIRILPVEYFYALPHEKRMELNNYQEYLTENSVGVHLWSSSWKKLPSWYYYEHKQYFKGFLTYCNEVAFRMKKLLKSYFVRVFRIVFGQKLYDFFKSLLT